MKLTVIGAGPGGYEAAIYAAKKGFEVVLIDKDELGGTCLNRGCIPTKALIASYDAYEAVADADDFGILKDGTVTIDYEKIIERKNKVVKNLVKGIGMLIKANKITYVNGFGSLVDKNTVKVVKEGGEEELISTDYVILATGSVPTVPKMFGYDGKRVISSNEILDMNTLPESIIIVGGGVIGCEIGQFLAKMGSDVTVVEMQDRILSTCDEDVIKHVLRQFKKDKVKVITSDGVSEVIVGEDSVEVTLNSGKSLSAEYLMVSVGRRPYTEGLNLDNAGVELTERGFIKTDETLRTTADNIYAIGDILSSYQLAHVASKEAFVAVDNILGKNKQMKYNAVPACVFTNPQVATVGKTEFELKDEGVNYKVGTFDFKTLGKAQASGHHTGFVKVITDENDVIIGAAIVGHEASDMLQVLTTAVTLGLTAEEVGDCIFPHPTMCEAIMEALHDLHGVSIHKV